MTVILISGWATYAQNSTDSTVEPNKEIVIKGKRYILLDEETFARVERTVAELKQSRTAIEALQKQIETLEKLNTKNEQILELKDRQIEILTKAVEVADKALEAMKEADRSNQKAIEVLQQQNADLARKLKNARRWNLASIVGLIVLVVKIL